MILNQDVKFGDFKSFLTLVFLVRL